MAEGKQYFTVKDVFDAAVKLAKADPYFEQYNKICVLDYDLILRDCEDGTLYRAEFDVLGDVSYGGSEGIYGDIYLCGSWNKDQNDFRRNRARVYVLKTLKCDKESYLAIGMLVNLICYYANKFISNNMDAPLAPFEKWIERIVIFRWDCTYPADRYFDLQLGSGQWHLVGTSEFAGHSHDLITMEVYER